MGISAPPPSPPPRADSWHFVEDYADTMKEAEDLMDKNLELLTDEKAEELEAGGEEEGESMVARLSSRKKSTKQHGEATEKVVPSILTGIQ